MLSNRSIDKAAVAILLLLFTLGCRQSHPESTSKAPQRIISLVPSVTELIWSVGAGERLVGVTWNDNYPPPVQKLPKIGDQAVDLEKVLELKPDLVVLDSNFNQDKDKLERLGVPVLELRCERLDDIPQAMRTLGRELDCRDSADSAAESFEERLKTIEPLGSAQPIFIEIWGEPLMTVGSKTLMADIFTHLNLVNCYADQEGYFQVDPESMISRRPEIILYPRSADQSTDSRALELCGRVGLEPVLVEVNPDLLIRPGPRILDGMEALRKNLIEL